MRITKSMKEKITKLIESGEMVGMVREAATGMSAANPADMYKILKPYMSSEPDREQFVVVFLDSANHIKAIETLFVGTINETQVYPREVVKRALYHHSTAVVIAHNHPSGSLKPSEEDKKITRQVALACATMDITVHDHLIIGDGFFSFTEIMPGVIRDAVNRYKDILDEF